MAIAEKNLLLNGDCLKKLTTEWRHMRESVIIIRLFDGER